MNNGRWILILLLVCTVLLSRQGSATVFIAGYVNDSIDGTIADNHTVVVWNPRMGVGDNLTAKIGPSGSAGKRNAYLLDCELLQNSCAIGDIMAVRVMDSGDGYSSASAAFAITASGFQLAPPLQLRAPPRTSFASLMLAANSTQTLSCSAHDADGDLAVLEINGNWSGIWTPNRWAVSGGEAAVNFTLGIFSLISRRQQDDCQLRRPGLLDCSSDGSARCR